MDERVAALVAEVARRRAERVEVRRVLAVRRMRGLAVRHAVKLARRD